MLTVDGFSGGAWWNARSACWVRYASLAPLGLEDSCGTCGAVCGPRDMYCAQCWDALAAYLRPVYGASPPPATEEEIEAEKARKQDAKVYAAMDARIRREAREERKYQRGLREQEKGRLKRKARLERKAERQALREAHARARDRLAERAAERLRQRWIDFHDAARRVDNLIRRGAPNAYAVVQRIWR